MKKSRFSFYFVFVSFFTFITIFISIVQKSYFSLLKPQQDVENNALLKDINPNLDLSVLSEIEARDKNTEDNFDFSILKPVPSDTVTPTIIPTSEPVSTTSSNQTNINKISPTP